MSYEVIKTSNIGFCFGVNRAVNAIYDILRKDSLTMDEIVTKTNLNINDLMVILTKLELDGVISQTHGEKYIIIN